jgi:ABC-type Fe3+ transport system substrate-binding protein
MASFLPAIFGVVICSALVSAHGGGWYGSHYHSMGGGSGTSGSTSTGASSSCQVETRSMDQLYRAALAEGGKLVIYAGGDAPDQQIDTKNNFEATFPGMKVEIVVDFSKFHGPRIDYQLQTNTVVFDLAQLQTLQDFPRWKDEGVLLNYKPIGWERVYADYKDSDGAYMGILMSAFSTNVNRQLLGNNNATWPLEAKDWLNPALKNKIVVTYPNDDDAVLFWFKQVVDKYGFSYLQQFKAQNPKFVRGTAAAGAMVGSGQYAATMSADGGLNDIAGLPRFAVPKNDPFVLWPQQAAIFKKAAHPEAAKLYMSWAIDKKVQQNGWSWSVRDDVVAPAPFKCTKCYGVNGNPQAFMDFMADRTAVEIFKNQITMIFGQVEGPNPNGELGMHPTQGYPTINPLTAPPSP